MSNQLGLKALNNEIDRITLEDELQNCLESIISSIDNAVVNICTLYYKYSFRYSPFSFYMGHASVPNASKRLSENARAVVASIPPFLLR